MSLEEYNINQIVLDLTGTDTYLDKYLQQKGIDLKLLDKIQVEVNQRILQCEVCDQWDEAGEMTNDHCEFCWADAPENTEEE